MAKKAGDKAITTWVFLDEAIVRTASAYRSRALAERRLGEWLLADRLHWHSDDLEGSKRDCDPGSGDPEFWREPSLVPGTLFYPRSLVIAWDESWVLRQRDDTHSYKFSRIQVAMDDLAKLLPVAGIRASAVKPKDWLAAEVERIKRARETVPSGKTEFARLLEGRIKDAALRGEVMKPVGSRYIESLLGTLKLWPISPA